MHELKLKFQCAKKQHQDMIDTDLLHFEAYFYEFEVADIVHASSWAEKSADIFRDLFKVSAEESNVGTHWQYATHLIFALKMALMVCYPCSQAGALQTKGTKAHEIPTVRATVLMVLNEFFDYEQGGYASLFSVEEENESSDSL